ncbi:hypothetical protein T484DRAFT_1936121, partial [Baffinella frigidus]
MDVEGGGGEGGPGGGGECSGLEAELRMLCVGTALVGDIVIPGMGEETHLTASADAEEEAAAVAAGQVAAADGDAAPALPPAPAPPGDGAGGEGGEEQDGVGRPKYSLDILREEQDELGNTVLIGRHAAYGDHQTCQLKLVREAGKVIVHYSDGETHCSGEVDAKQRRIVGTVNQLVAGEEGFWAARAEVTHTFTLAVAPSSAKERRLRAEMGGLRETRLIALLDFLAKASKNMQMAKLGLDAMSMLPSELLQDTLNLAEDACALMRRQAALLHDLTFATTEERTATLASLDEAGVSRKKAHTITDRAFLTVRAVHQLNEIVHQQDFKPSDLISVMWKAHQRLDQNFQRLDQAIANAEKRLPVSVVDGWRQACSAGDTCMICLLELEVGSSCIALPCSHKFHGDCAAFWLHGHSTCPNCRQNLVPEEAAAPAAGGLSGELLADASSSEAKPEAG